MFDPKHIFDKAKKIALSVSDEAIEKVITELAEKVIDGELSDKEELYRLCENLWTGLNELLEELGIDYRSNNVLKI